MTRLFAGLAVAALAAVALAQGPQSTPRAAAPAAADLDTQDVVFLADDRPYLLRLHLYTGGRPFRYAWEEFLATVFNAVDRNRDGVIGADEIAQLNSVQTALG